MVALSATISQARLLGFLELEVAWVHCVFAGIMRSSYKVASVLKAYALPLGQSSAYTPVRCVAPSYGCTAGLYSNVWRCVRPYHEPACTGDDHRATLLEEIPIYQGYDHEDATSELFGIGRGIGARSSACDVRCRPGATKDRDGRRHHRVSPRQWAPRLALSRPLQTAPDCESDRIRGLAARGLWRRGDGASARTHGVQGHAVASKHLARTAGARCAIQRHHIARPHELCRDSAGERRQPGARHCPRSRPSREQLYQA